MKEKRGRLGAGALATLLLPLLAGAQAPPPSEAAGFEALVQELRLLRRAVERQNATLARTHLLLARLTLQDQRVARQRTGVERLEGELAGLEREQAQMQATAQQLAQALEEAREENHRRALEQESRLMRSRLANSTQERQKLEARLAQARLALDAEAARYEELEGWLADVERELQRGDGR